MPIKKRLYRALTLAVSALLITPALLLAVSTVTSCSRDGASPAVRPGSAPPLGTAQEASCGAPVYDEYVGDFILDGVRLHNSSSTWATVSNTGPSCPGGGVDITSQLLTLIGGAGAGTPLALSAQTPGGVNVVYIQQGNYCIHQTIQLVDALGVTIVGDPAGTTITWAGPAGDDMFQIVDSDYVKVSRLTLNGAGTATVLVHAMQSACFAPNTPQNGAPQNALCNLPAPSGPSVSAYSSYFFELNDDVFENAAYGVAGDVALTGTAWGAPCAASQLSQANCLGSGPPSELCCPPHGGGIPGAPWDPGANQVAASNNNLGNFVIRRSTFSSLTTYGLLAQTSNAFVWVVADSFFKGNGLAPQNPYRPSAAIAGISLGNINVINNTFSMNERDMYFDPSGVSTVVRGNTSIGSNAFLFTDDTENDVSGNYVQLSGCPVPTPGTQQQVDWDECSSPYAICLGSLWGTTLFDNYVNVPPPGAGCPGALTNQNAVVTDTTVHWTSPLTIAEGGNVFVGANSTSSPTNFIIGSDLSPTGAIVLNVPSPSGSQSSGPYASDLFAASGGSPPPPPAAQIALSSSSTYLNGATTQPWNQPALASARTVTNVGSSCSANPVPPTSACVTAITNALSSAQGPIGIYFPAGSYYINSTINVPPGLDVTFFGDGPNSAVYWTGQPPTSPGPDPYMIHFQAGGPNHLSPVGSVRDLSLVTTGLYPNGSGTNVTSPGGILVDVNDNPGDMVFLDTFSGGACRSAIEVAGVDNTIVRADQSGGGLERMAVVSGGGAAAPAQGSAGTQGLTMFAGGGNPISSLVALKGWGKAVLVGTDNEGDTQGITLDQTGYLTVAGGRLLTWQNPSASYPTQNNVLAQSTFRGNATFASMLLNAQLLSPASTEGHVLSLGAGYLPGYGAPPYSGATCAFSQASNVAAAYCTQMEIFDEDDYFNTTGQYSFCSPQAGPCGPTAMPGVGAPLVLNSTGGAFVYGMLNDLRTTYEVPQRTWSCTQANVRIHRVLVNGNVPFNSPTDMARAAVRVEHN